jgi:hypothetical protein
MRNFQRGAYFKGCLNIRPTLTFESTVAVLAEALGLTFHPDQDGKYEEYPAYISQALGLEFALLAPPHPEYDLREIRDNNFQLLVSTRARVTDDGVDVDLSALIEAQILANSDLSVERVEHINAP